MLTNGNIEVPPAVALCPIAVGLFQHERQTQNLIGLLRLTRPNVTNGSFRTTTEHIVSDSGDRSAHWLGICN